MIGQLWLIRLIAMIRPTRNDRAIDTTGSFIVTHSPERIQSRFFPEVKIALSFRYFRKERFPHRRLLQSHPVGRDHETAAVDRAFRIRSEPAQEHLLRLAVL